MNDEIARRTAKIRELLRELDEVCQSSNPLDELKSDGLIKRIVKLYGDIVRLHGGARPPPAGPSPN